MKSTRKMIAGMIAALGIAGAAAMAYADPPRGYGPGYGGGPGDCAFGGGGPGMMGYGGWGGGPGMMGYGGPRGGYGPGMGYGGRRGGGYGPGMMSGWGPRGGFGPGAGAGPVAHHEARLAFLKEALKITEDQQAAWDAYATQVKAQAATMEAFHAQAPSADQTPAERIEQRAAFAKLRAEQAQALSTAVKELYAALTPEQKAVADQHFGGPRLAGRGYGRGR